MLFLSGLLFLLPSAVPLLSFSALCSYSMNAEIGVHEEGGAGITVINDHHTWLTLTRVNIMIAQVNTLICIGLLECIQRSPPGKQNVYV